MHKYSYAYGLHSPHSYIFLLNLHLKRKRILLVECLYVYGEDLTKQRVQSLYNVVELLYFEKDKSIELLSKEFQLLAFILVI